uniref:ANAPC4_WD40 domain-containing protein n=1 Tax=Rodentolepis nana TaxID=102285 RepID=A0A0R3TP44_RODNA
LCMLERVDAKDVLHFYDTEDSQWCRFKSTTLSTRDAASVQWSPDGRYIVVFDSLLYDSINILNSDGKTLHSLHLYGVNVGNKPASHFTLGIRSFNWAPSGHILAAGRYDNTCLLYNHANWKVLAELKHPLDIPIDPILGLDCCGEIIESRNFERGSVKPHKVAIYIERLIEEQPYYCRQLTATTRAEELKDAYVISRLPYTVKSTKIDPKKPNPKIGVGLCLFSPNGGYLATRVENAPHAIWIWSIGGLHISLVGLLCHSSAVTSVQWDPRLLPAEFTRLAFCTASGRVFIWSPEGCLSMTVEKPGSPFPVKTLSWGPSGDTLLLQSSKSFCLLHLKSAEGEAIFKPLEPTWTAPSRGRGPLEENNRDPQTPATHSTFPADAKSDLPKWALSAHRLARKTFRE